MRLYKSIYRWCGLKPERLAVPLRSAITCTLLGDQSKMLGILPATTILCKFSISMFLQLIFLLNVSIRCVV